MVVHDTGLRMALGLVTAQPVVDGTNIREALPRMESACELEAVCMRLTFRTRTRNGQRGYPSCAMVLEIPVCTMTKSSPHHFFDFTYMPNVPYGSKFNTLHIDGGIGHLH